MGNLEEMTVDRDSWRRIAERYMADNRRINAARDKLELERDQYQARAIAAEAIAASEFKWLDPECGTGGCQSLVWKGRYESAVKGRQDFRRAFRELKTAQAASEEQPQVSDEDRPLTAEEEAMIDAAWGKHKAANPL